MKQGVGVLVAYQDRLEELVRVGCVSLSWQYFLFWMRQTGCWIRGLRTRSENIEMKGFRESNTKTVGIELRCGQGHVVSWGGADHGQAGAELQGRAEEAGGGGL